MTALDRALRIAIEARERGQSTRALRIAIEALEKIDGGAIEKPNVQQVARTALEQIDALAPMSEKRP